LAATPMDPDWMGLRFFRLPPTSVSLPEECSFQLSQRSGGHDLPSGNEACIHGPQHRSSLSISLKRDVLHCDGTFRFSRRPTMQVLELAHNLAMA
jgi:hypothetical protein